MDAPGWRAARGRGRGPALGALGALAALSGALAGAVGAGPEGFACDVRISSGSNGECHDVAFDLPPGPAASIGMRPDSVFSLCPREDFPSKKRKGPARARTRRGLPGGSNRVLVSAAPSRLRGRGPFRASAPGPGGLWAAVTYGEDEEVTLATVRDSHSTLLSVQRNEDDGGMTCFTAIDNIVMKGVKDIVRQAPGALSGKLGGRRSVLASSPDPTRRSRGRTLQNISYDQCPAGQIVVNMIVEIDKPYVDHARGGNGDLATARQNAEDLMQLVAAEYLQQLGLVLDFEIFYDGHDYGTSDPDLLIDRLEVRWSSLRLEQSQNNLVHLFTGTPMDSGVIGVAYVSAACAGNYKFGFSEVTFNNMVSCMKGLVMHEIGHNVGSYHVNIGEVMNAVLTCSNTFSDQAKGMVSSYMNSVKSAIGDPDNDTCGCGSEGLDPVCDGLEGRKCKKAGFCRWQGKKFGGCKHQNQPINCSDFTKKRKCKKAAKKWQTMCIWEKYLKPERKSLGKKGLCYSREAGPEPDPVPTDLITGPND